MGGHFLQNDYGTSGNICEIQCTQYYAGSHLKMKRYAVNVERLHCNHEKNSGNFQI